MKQKLALSIIVKDDSEAKDLERMLLTISPYVSGIFITGTKDPQEEVKKICKKFGANWSWFSWEDDFSKARNFAMSQIPKDYTHLIWLDTDDVFLGGEGIKQTLEMMSKSNIDAISMEYIYLMSDTGLSSFFKTGKVDRDQIVLTHKRERIVKLGVFKWVGALHETLIPQVKEPRMISTELMRVLHLTTQLAMKNATERNLRIMEATRAKELKEGKTDPRTTFYLARTYFDIRRLEEAEELLKEYINSSGWDEEVASAWSYLGDVYQLQGKHKDALFCFFEAIKIRPDFPEYYAGISTSYCFAKKFELAKHWALSGLKLPAPNTSNVLKPRSSKALLLEALAEACVQLNDFDGAWSATMAIKKIDPKSSQIDARIKFLNSLIEEREITKKYVDIVKYLEDCKEIEKIPFLVNSIPDHWSDNAIFSSIINNYKKPKNWEDNEIVIYSGPGFEVWSPDNLKKGIGGSEEAIIYLSKELVKKGWKVTVFGDPPVEKKYDGVDYKIYTRFNIRDNFNILVLWRRVQMLDTKFNAKKVLLDLHDVPMFPDFTKERMENVDAILVKSNYHRNFLNGIPHFEKVKVISNGLDVLGLEKLDNQKRDNKAVFWGSSYDRGLQNLLEIWGDVIKEVPDATLHICYGWNLFNSFYSNNPERMAWKDKITELMKQKGIFHYERVGHPELEKIMLGCGILGYYCTFEEINCITAIRSQALGCVPVVTDFAALKEIVQHGIKVPGDVHDSTTKKEYLKELISMIKDKDKQEEIRETMMSWAKDTFDWKVIASQWEEVFKEKNK